MCNASELRFKFVMKNKVKLRDFRKIFVDEFKQ